MLAELPVTQSNDAARAIGAAHGAAIFRHQRPTEQVSVIHQVPPDQTVLALQTRSQHQASILDGVGAENENLPTHSSRRELCRRSTLVMLVLDLRDPPRCVCHYFGGDALWKQIDRLVLQRLRDRLAGVVLCLHRADRNTIVVALAAPAQI